MAAESLTPDMLPVFWDSGALHGPFKSAAAAEANSRTVLLGEDCVVTNMGEFVSSNAIN